MASEGTEQAQPQTPVRPGNGAAPNTVMSEHDFGATAAEESVAREDENGEESEEEDEDTEPNLRYTKLTGSLSSVYRNGDSTSTFTAAGDKLVIGTHYGSIHTFALPSFQPIRVYQAHKASITALSVSSVPSASRPSRHDDTSRPHPVRPTTPNTPSKSGSTKAASAQSPKSPRQPPVPHTASNQIYIASASVDGHVCVSSLVDPKDVTLRNYARPVQAVALSPDFRNDRTYLSGGLAGELILTVGGRAGVSANANTNSAAAAASGWLGSIGLTSSSGKDSILHSGDGAIKIIKWSLSGRYVVWVDEMGVNVMRSNLHLDSAEADHAWKRINLLDRPRRRTWEDMAAVWQARAEWIDEGSTEMPEGFLQSLNEKNGVQRKADSKPSSLQASPAKTNVKKRAKPTEKLLVGWGDMVWYLQVKSESVISKSGAESLTDRVECVHVLNLDDCIISGLALYTPSLLLVLAYPTQDEKKTHAPTSNEITPRRGIKRRQNGQPPEIRLVELASGDIIESDALTVKNYESMTGTDYHISTIFVPDVHESTSVARGTFGTIGGGLWDMGASATRLFSSGTSVLSGSSSGEKIPAASPATTAQSTTSATTFRDFPSSLMKPGLKIFLQSPYDCVLATKRDLSDRMTWLLEHESYQEAWELASSNPEVVSPQQHLDSRPSTPSRADQSMVEFFEDDILSQESSSGTKNQHSAVEKEKRRIGELWMEQLIAAQDWRLAGETASKVLGTSQRWEYWILQFVQAQRFDEIVPYIPPKRLRPSLPSSVYERILEHYIAHDKLKLQEILAQWDPNMFNIPNVISVVESSIDGTSNEDDRRIMLNVLAQLYLAATQPKDALSCYIRVQNADAALELVREYQLLDSVTSDIYSFILLRISKQQLASASLNELDRLSAEPISLLIDGTRQGLIQADDIIHQVQVKEPQSLPFLFFYFRSLWNDEGAIAARRPTIPRHRIDVPPSEDQTTSPLRTALNSYADLAVKLFAEYSSSLLLPFLKSSTSYSFDLATNICESRGYIPELVYLLSITGQAKRALHLIIDSLDDVSQAIGFAKECDDKELWDDLMAYSMDKPAFIRALLEEVGTSESVDTLELIRRIPDELVIDGLKEGLGRILRDFECQWSICEGVARVLQSEVAEALDILDASRRRGMMFEVLDNDKSTETKIESKGETDSNTEASSESMEIQPRPTSGRCGICSEPYNDTEDDFLLGFSCGHVFHLACLFDELRDKKPTSEAAIERVQRQLLLDVRPEEEADKSWNRSVATKVTHAHLIKSVLGDKGCPIHDTWEQQPTL